MYNPCTYNTAILLLWRCKIKTQHCRQAARPGIGSYYCEGVQHMLPTHLICRLHRVCCMGSTYNNSTSSLFRSSTFLDMSVDPVAFSPYHYFPTEYVAILFVSLFGLSTALHVGQSIYFRAWWALPTIALAGLLEVLGWSARIWSSISPFLLSPYEMQLTLTILAPTPLVAGNFVILGRIIRDMGPQYSRLPPRWYAIIFCSFDIISLIVQAVGGGIAATAAGQGTDPTLGGHVMLGGIVFQMATITIYVFCALEFFIRYIKDTPLKSSRKGSVEAKPQTSISGDSTDTVRPEIAEHSKRGSVMSKKLQIMTFALLFSTLCLFIRAVYRTIELSDGWSGRIISTQVYFNVLDGTMIVLAIYTLNLVHPDLFLTPVERTSMASPDLEKNI
ncbi:hypothetical protein D9757_009003 [Collybiopsis confluens]|uniref:RTA1-domain-containing protein n=1 Tax=Collybiopsis confluens TaxID=2823264 RepID=A0A8H5H378_9AGAR|nr:hypothetical protein D9757_009003 [Collybiopsis confluens]